MLKTTFWTTIPGFRITNLKQKIIEKCSLVSKWLYVSIGSYTVLASTRRQTIIWTNDEIVY